MSDGGPRPFAVALAYGAAACLYLLYLPHAEFLLDDWGVIARFEEARRGGAGEMLGVAGSLVRNTFHRQFRFQWLSFSIGYALVLVFGRAPAVMFAALALAHTACAVVLRQAMEKLGVAPGVAFLSGLVFLLLPSTHPALLWSQNCSFFVWSTLWFLLYLRSLAGSLVEGRLERAAALRQALFLLLALFSGDPVFGLLVTAAPLTAWYLRSRLVWRATALAWGVVGTAAAVYALWINRIPLVQQGVGLRYQFSLHNLKANLVAILETYGRLAGVTDGAFYRLRPSLAAVVVLVALAWGLRRFPRSPARLRDLVLAAGLWAAAYGPVWFIRGHEYRYDYTASPYLALLLSLAVGALPVARRALAAGLVAWAAVAAVASLEQGWIPQSRDVRAIAAKLRENGPFQAGDVVVVSGTPMWLGAAPHFAFLTDWAARAFAAQATGVRDLEAGCEIVEEAGRLRLYQRTAMRDLRPEQLARTLVLVRRRERGLAARRLLASPAGPDAFRVYALKGYAGPPPSVAPLSREQLQVLEDQVYWVRAVGGRQRVEP